MTFMPLLLAMRSWLPIIGSAFIFPPVGTISPWTGAAIIPLVSAAAAVSAFEPDMVVAPVIA